MNRFLKPKLEKSALLFIGFVLLTAIFLWSERITGQTGEPAPFDSMTYPFADSVPTLPDSAAAVINYRKIENKAFGYGEKLVFSVNYGFINAGSALLEIDTIIDVRGRDCFRIVSRAKSNSFFSKFFKVDDRVATYVDTEGIYPLYFEKHLREGKFKTDRWVRFDQKSRLAIESKGDTTVIPLFVQDVLSAMFYVRTLSLEVGKSVYIDNYADRKNYPLEVRVLKKERKKVDAGEFDCFVVEPLLQEGSGIFANRGKLTVWLSDDQYRLPVFMRSKVIFIGSISAELKSYKLGKIGVLSASSGN